MKIMIVEDERTIAELVGETVQKWGFTPVLAQDFEQVLHTFVREEPQLVLMDVNLPAFDGFYWCRQIRQLSQVPMIFVSSRTTPMDMIMAMNMGGDDYIQKPFYPDVLMAKINALLRRAYSYMEISSDVLEHNGVVLNLRDGTALCGEQKIELTKNEFKILGILLRQHGTIVSRDKLMRSLWEDESFVDDNTLTVNMTRLRKKMDELGKLGFIETRKGQGYIIP